MLSKTYLDLPAAAPGTAGGDNHLLQKKCLSIWVNFVARITTINPKVYSPIKVINVIFT